MDHVATAHAIHVIGDSKPTIHRTVVIRQTFFARKSEHDEASMPFVVGGVVPEHDMVPSFEEDRLIFHSELVADP